MYRGGFNYWTIAPTSPLPPVGAYITIDGASQPGVVAPTNPYGLPEIVLSGANAGQGADGLDLQGGGDTVVELTINGFSGDGLNVESSHNTIQFAVDVGTDVTGTISVGNSVGIYVTGAYNVIGTDGKGGPSLDFMEGNVIAGNVGPGLWITGPDAIGNVIGADYIGLGFYGSPLANGGDGVLIDGGATDNWIGVNSVYAPETAADGNSIESNAAAGVEISGAGSSGNVVAGDVINSNGTDGVLIDGGATGNWIGVNPVDGSADALQSNNINNNTAAGVVIGGAARPATWWPEMPSTPMAPTAF